MENTNPVHSWRRIGAWMRPRTRILAPFFTLVILVLFFWAVTGSFFTLRNFRNILEQASLLAILATGVTLVLLLGEIDLSFANVATLIGMIMALLADHQVHTAAVVLVCVGSALVVGFTNGYVTSYVRVPSFMATLAMYQIAYGVAHYISKAIPVFSVPQVFSVLGNKNLGFVPWVVICAVVVMGGAHFVLKYTRFGRYVYMTGGNREAARVSGSTPGW